MERLDKGRLRGLSGVKLPHNMRKQMGQERSFNATFTSLRVNGESANSPTTLSQSANAVSIKDGHLEDSKAEESKNPATEVQGFYDKISFESSDRKLASFQSAHGQRKPNYPQKRTGYQETSYRLYDDRRPYPHPKRNQVRQHFYGGESYQHQKAARDHYAHAGSRTHQERPYQHASRYQHRSKRIPYLPFEYNYPNSGYVKY